MALISASIDTFFFIGTSEFIIYLDKKSRQMELCELIKQSFRHQIRIWAIKRIQMYAKEEKCDEQIRRGSLIYAYNSNWYIRVCQK